MDRRRARATPGLSPESQEQRPEALPSGALHFGQPHSLLSSPRWTRAQGSQEKWDNPVGGPVVSISAAIAWGSDMSGLRSQHCLSGLRAAALRTDKRSQQRECCEMAFLTQRNRPTQTHKMWLCCKFCPEGSDFPDSGLELLTTGDE